MPSILIISKPKLIIYQDTKSCLCGDRHEVIKEEYSKLAPKEYKNIYDWVGKVTHWELRKNLNFNILTQGKFTNQNLSLKLKRIKTSGTLI